MFQLKMFGFIALLGSVIPLLGMNEVNRLNGISGELDAVNAIVPTIEATIMTTLATLPQAMMYIPFKEAIVFTLNSAAMTGFISTVGYALPSIALGCLLGSGQRNYSDKQFVIEWRKPLSVSLALLTTCFMLSFNQKELSHNFGI